MTDQLSISRTRGDTFPIRMTMTNPDGTAMDLTGKQVLLTVNTEEDPTDETNQVFQLVGTITDALAGAVEFPLTEYQADNVGRFFFDVEVSDVSGVTVWQPNDGTYDDGTIIDPNGAHGIGVMREDATFNTIDGRKCVSFEVAGGDTMLAHPVLISGPRTLGFKCEMTVYIDNGRVTLQMLDAAWEGCYDHTKLNLLNGTELEESVIYFTDQGVASYADSMPSFDVTGWDDDPGWFVIGQRFNRDGTFDVQYKREEDPDNWKSADLGVRRVQGIFLPFNTLPFFRTGVGGHLVGLYQIKWTTT